MRVCETCWFPPLWTSTYRSSSQPGLSDRYFVQHRAIGRSEADACTTRACRRTSTNGRGTGTESPRGASNAHVRPMARTGRRDGMWLIGTASIAFVLALTVVTSQPRPASFSQDEPHGISRQGDQSGGSRGAGKTSRARDLSLRHIWRRAALDRRAADARGPRRGGPGHRAGGWAQSRCRGTDARDRRGTEGRRRRPHGSGCNTRTAAAECRRRRSGQDRQRWPAGQRGHHLRPVPFHGRQLAHVRHRQTTGRMGECRPQCRSNRGALPGARRRDQGRVQRLGPGKIRSSSPRVRRHQPPAAEQPVGANRHTADLWVEGRRLRDVHRRRSRSRTGTAT